MFYTAVMKTQDGRARAQLALSICDNINNIIHCWRDFGPIFGETVFWSKSGALLKNRNSLPHYLFWGDTNIFIAITNNFINYTNTNRTLMKVRENYFDSELIEPAGEPLLLSNGDYLFIYNAANKTNLRNPKPNWNLQYHIGYVILDGKNPLIIKQRSNVPILSPELDWEKCDRMENPFGLTPFVVFIEGWKKINDNKFLVYYQGCDSFMGIGEINIQ